jgi:polysaccharide biosynthesis protein VpsM
MLSQERRRRGTTHALMPHRIAFLLVGVAWATVAVAQTPTPPGPPGTGVSPPTTPPVETAPTGRLLVPGNPASPSPNPDLASRAAFPEQRGFVRAEPFYIYPILGVGFGYNDNLTGVPEDRISSALILASVRVRGDVKTGANTYALTYIGNFGHYFSSSENDFNEHAFVATSSNQFTARADLEAAAFYLIKQDPGGSVDRPFTGTPDRWHGAGATATFGYGAPSAQGRLEGDLGVTDKRYQNNREVTEAFDVSTWNLGARFFYRIAPEIRLLAEIGYTEYDYHLTSSPLDSSEQRYLLGATWELTAATRGTLKAGYITKEFRQEGVEGYSGPTVEAALRWLPRTYSEVELAARYGPVDTTGTATFTVDTSVGVRWEHHWRSYFLTRAFATYVNSELQGVSQTDRIGRVGFGAYFDIRSWLRIGADVMYEKRNSTDSAFDFSRNVVLLSIAGTL